MSVVKDFFGGPKIKPPPSVANTPSRPAEPIGDMSPTFQSLISTGQTKGLTRKANTRKRTLIGGS